MMVVVVGGGRGVTPGALPCRQVALVCWLKRDEMRMPLVADQVWPGLLYIF